jgi:hypothetical protein
MEITPTLHLSIKLQEEGEAMEEIDVVDVKYLSN